MALWSISGVTGLRCIPLSNLDVGRWGLSRSSKYRGLACLEEAGLVAVKRKLGRAPMVTILDVELEP
jgi:DNA-binding transcriptional ArsR family regulator